MITTSRAADLFSRLEQGGEPAILELIATRKAEELFLDFKRSTDYGAGKRLHDNDRNNLAKAISGFGNSEGGIIVWGVDCSHDPEGADVARLKMPIQNVARFVSWLEGAVSGCTIPPHQGVRSIAVAAGDPGEGYAVTLIPKSNQAPHQVVGRLQYYIRAGSDFVPTPHAVLAGMFGRMPQPHVFHSYVVARPKLEGIAVKSSVGIMIRNDGPGIASDLFVNATIYAFAGKNVRISFDVPDKQNWTGTWGFGRKVALISKPGFRLQPEAEVQPLLLDLTFAPPFEDQFEIRGIAGAGGAPPYRFKLHQTREELERAYDEYLSLERAGKLTEDRARALQQVLMGHHDPEGQSGADL
jgi:hypothetical protein